MASWLLNQRTNFWRCSAGTLQLMCLLALVDAGVVSRDLSGSSDSSTTMADNREPERGQCTGIIVKGTGECRCSRLSEIRCRYLTDIPEFTVNVSDTLYSAAHLDQQEITSLPASAFRHLAAARITMNFNPLGSAVSADALRGLESSLEELELGGCRLTTLPEGLLDGMFRLRRLHLWANRIERIPGGFFGGADELRELYLWGNELSELDELSLGGLWNLRLLDLDRNGVSTVGKDTFRHLLELTSLRLNDNEVEALYADTFAYMESLRSLSLDRNRISYVHETAFAGLSTLLSLSLSHNQISYLPNELFSPLVNLAVLRLDGNRVEYVWPRTFIGLGQLRRLDLGGNDIGSLPDGALRHSPGIQKVVLDGNRLTTLRQCSLATTASVMPSYLRRLSLVGNPLYCDCRLSWLLDFGKRTKVWWAACRGGTADNQTAVVRHHAYHGVTQRTCNNTSLLSHDCPFTR